MPNLAATAVRPLERPWNLAFEGYPDFVHSKADYMRWVNAQQTRGCFFTLAEGVTKELRISAAMRNRLFGLWGLCVDYDAPIRGTLKDMAKQLRESPLGEHLPQWICLTFSGQARLIWEFNKCAMLVNDTHFKHFMLLLNRKLKLNKWLPGLDGDALSRATQFYEWGREWCEVSPASERVPDAMVDHLIYEAASKTATLVDETTTGAKVPIEEIARAVQEKFPGRWDGPFVLGSRGVRFWDAKSDCPTATVVTPDGMLCFTGPVPFMTWSQIFGESFIEAFAAAAVSDIMNSSAYDGRLFWTKDESGCWVDVSKEDFRQRLMCRGHSVSKARGATYSAVDKIEVTVKDTRRVSRALPFLFYPKEIIWYEGQKYLNISRSTPLEPAPLKNCALGIEDFHTAGPAYFPFIYKLTMSMFAPVSSKDAKPDPNEPVKAEVTDEAVQLERLLAYIQHAYVNAVRMTPKAGQCMILAGPVGKGKTLYVRRVFAALMGGYSEAAGHLVDGSQWTDEMVSNPVMCIDDSLGAADHKDSLKFSARIKKYVANGTMVFEQKYLRSGKVPWLGRIVITCNLDSESMRIIPQADISMREKIMLFKCSPAMIDFPSNDIIESTITRELPFFARFLVEWQTPGSALSSEKRFGIKPYQHPDLYDESMRQGLDAILLEIIEGYLTQPITEKPRLAGEKYYVCTLTQLHRDLSDINPGIMRDIRPRQLTICLGNLEKNGYNIHKVKHNGTKLAQYWKFGYDLLGGFSEQAEGK
jgi:hypothetical protein